VVRSRNGRKALSLTRTSSLTKPAEDTDRPRGPSAHVRNPMSLGAVTMTFGLALFCRPISILLFLLIQMFVVFVEEPGLEKRFGESYLHYKLSVNRWLPTVRR